MPSPEPTESKLSVLVTIVVIAAIAVAGRWAIGETSRYVNEWQNRPWFLTRFTARTAIERCAQFQHKTKLYFTVGEAEAAIPPSCHSFDFAADKTSIFKHYLATGAMQFSHFGNQLPPFPAATQGSLTLSTIDEHFLVDNIEECQAREVKDTTGAYELRLGKAVVVEITGIRKNGDQAFVDFKWHFESLNQVGKALPEIEFTKEVELSDPRSTPQEKSMAPFWVGSAELTKFDDGWRVATVNPSSLHYPSWDYSPEWPDPYFNWNAFDESENHY